MIFSLFSCSFFEPHTPPAIPSIETKAAEVTRSQDASSTDVNRQKANGFRPFEFLSTFIDVTALNTYDRYRTRYDLYCYYAYFCDDDVEPLLNRAKNTVVINSPIRDAYVIGEFYGGIQTVTNGLQNTLSASSPFDLNASTDLSALSEIWFGNTLFLPERDGDLFRQVDATAVAKWAPVLPTPDETWQNTTYKGIYQKVFVHFGRLMSHAYVHLRNDDVDQHVNAYVQVATNDSSEYQTAGFDHLLETYRDHLPQTMAPLAEQLKGTTLDEWETGYFSPPMAIGFWLRRHVDGSDEALWNVALGVLEKYDPEWIERLKERYPGVKDIWNGAQTATTKKHLFDPARRSYLQLENVPVFSEIWIDGTYHGIHGRAVVTADRHVVSSLNCLQQTEEMRDKSHCPCNHFKVAMEPGETKTLAYDFASEQICTTNGKLVSGQGPE